MDEQEKIKDTIIKTVEEICGVTIKNETTNLLEDGNGVILADWLYVLDELHRNYKYPVYEVIEKIDYHSFTLEGLIKEIGQEV